MPFQPDWVSPPGDTLADALEEQGLTQTDLAERTGYSRKHINDLMRGRAQISFDTASKLALVLHGASADFWIARESQYRASILRRERLDELEGSTAWLSTLPLADMLKLKWVRRFSHMGEQVEECLRYFAVASTDAWEKVWDAPLAAFRASAKVEMKFGSVAAWLRHGEREAAGQRCEPFDKHQFITSLPKLRSLTRERNPVVFVAELQRSCNQVGVAVVFAPTPTGCPASGAVKWLSPDKALLMLSLRYKSNDHLWFSFFHECGHLARHGKKLLFLENTDTISEEHEKEADAFARDLLIPPAEAAELRSLKSKAAVESFASRIGVAPGIVVGRMQREKLLPWTHYNDLKVRYKWTETDSP